MCTLRQLSHFRPICKMNVQDYIEDYFYVIPQIKLRKVSLTVIIIDHLRYIPLYFKGKYSGWQDILHFLWMKGVTVWKRFHFSIWRVQETIETICACKNNATSLGGLEPPTFRLTAERANRLRHRDSHVKV